MVSGFDMDRQVRLFVSGGGGTGRQALHSSRPPPLATGPMPACKQILLQLAAQSRISIGACIEGGSCSAACCMYADAELRWRRVAHACHAPRLAGSRVGSFCACHRRPLHHAPHAARLPHPPSPHVQGTVAALASEPTGTFVCRFSMSQPGCLVLSVKAAAGHPKADANNLIHAIIRVSGERGLEATRRGGAGLDGADVPAQRLSVIP